MSSLLKPENKAKLQSILKYHVIAGKALTAKTLQGGDVILKAGVKMVNGAHILSKVKTGNGTVYIKYYCQNNSASICTKSPVHKWVFLKTRQTDVTKDIILYKRPIPILAIVRYTVGLDTEKTPARSLIE